jgi:predicted nucleic acid-binding protein
VTCDAKSSMAAMAAGPAELNEALFLDTSLLVAATVEVHPSHGAATVYIDAADAHGSPMCISPQICREFLVVLTRQPVSGRTFTLDEALTALAGPCEDRVKAAVVLPPCGYVAVCSTTTSHGT